MRGELPDSHHSIGQPFEPLLSADEAAVLLCVHPKTLQGMARAGSVPCVRMGKYWRFRASSLDAWVREGLKSEQSRRVGFKSHGGWQVHHCLVPCGCKSRLGHRPACISESS